MKILAFPLLTAALLLAGPVPSGMVTLGPRDVFAAAKLSGKEVREIVAIVEQSAYDTPDSWTKELRVRRVELGDSHGLVLQGTSLLCGGTGNCQIFVLRKSNSKWLSLFANDQAPVGEGFQFGPGATNGIKDFTMVSNSSAKTAKRVTYKFNGKFYDAN